MGDLIRWCAGVASELNQCAARHAALSAWVTGK